MSAGPILVRIAGCSETGRVRESNEDCTLVVDLDTKMTLSTGLSHEMSGERGPLLILCDGMGGVAGGEIASRTACDAIADSMKSAPATDKLPVLARHLRRAVRRANQKILAIGLGDKALRGLGTTVSVAAIVEGTAVLAQVGDSRAYLLRGQELTQITRDQTVVAALIQAGRLTETAAPYSMQRGRILQALGTSDDVSVSISIAPLREGDRLVLCSDGLHEYVAFEPMRLAAGMEKLPMATAELSRLANVAGGEDNISVLIAEFRGGILKPVESNDDTPRFTEYDPDEEGENALATTSHIAWRLAHEAGLRKDGWPLAIPATSQHPVISDDLAQKLLADQSKVGIVPWLIVACLTVGTVLYLLL